MTDEEFQKIITDSKLSIRELADKLGVSQKTIITWSNGRFLPVEGLREDIVKSLED
jgi:DNA-binding XRE family transcriptional regulator